MSQPTEGRVDPRIERSRTVVRRAALEELAAVGWGAYTIDGVAARAGVARSTIYRLWSSKVALVTDALETLNQQPPPDLQATGGRGRVVQIVEHLVDALSDPTLSGCMTALVAAAEQEPDLATFHHRYSDARRRKLTEAIRAAVAAGEVDRDIDPALASVALAGAVFYRRAMTSRPLTRKQVPALVDLVLGPVPAA